MDQRAVAGSQHRDDRRWGQEFDGGARRDARWGTVARERPRQEFAAGEQRDGLMVADHDTVGQRLDRGQPVTWRRVRRSTRSVCLWASISKAAGRSASPWAARHNCVNDR